MTSVFVRLAESSRTILKVDLVHLWRVDGAGGLVLAQQTGELRGDCAPPARFGPGEGFAGWSAARAEPVIVADALDDPRLGQRGWFLAEGIRSLIAVPLVVDDAPVGVVVGLSRARRSWTTDEVTVIQAVSATAAEAVRGARLFAQASEQARELAALHEIGTSLVCTLDLATVLETIVMSAARLIGAERGAVFELDPGEGHLYPRATVGLRPEESNAALRLGRTAAGAAAETRAPFYMEDSDRDPAPGAGQETAGEGGQTILAVPVVSRDTVFGAIVVYWNSGHARDERELWLLGALAKQAAVAIENARLFQQAESRRRAADGLRELASLVSRSLDPVEVGQRIVDSVCELLGAESATLYRRINEAGDLATLASAGASVPAALRSAHTIPAGVGVIGLAVRDRRTVVTTDILDDPRVTLIPTLREAYTGKPNRAVAAAPLLSGDVVLGGLAVRGPRALALDADAVRLLETFAGQAALALENARLHATTVRRAQQLATLNELARSVTTTLDRAEVAQHVLQAAQVIIPGAVGRLWEIVDGDQGLRVMASLGLHEPGASMDTTCFIGGEGLLGRAIATGEAIICADATEDPEFLGKDWARAEGVVSAITVPFLRGARAIGVLSIFTRGPHAFSEEEVDLLRSFTAHAAAAVDNARLFDATRAQARVLTEKNAELDAFVYSVSHDLKAPLVSIQGMLGLLHEEAGAALPRDSRRLLERIDANAQQMEQLILDLLALSRVGREGRPPAAVSLAATADEVLDELAGPIQERGIKVERGDLPTVIAIRTQMEQVFRNLVGNAVKYLGNTPAPVLVIGARDAGDVIECWVSDNGVGIDPAYHARIFDVFQRLKDVDVEGSGLGLAIVRKIVEGGGGRVWVESARGAGATFRFTWPKTSAGRSLPPGA